MSTETDHDTGSDSSPSSPRHKNQSFSLPLRLSHSRTTGPPSSPESDLDVDSAPDDITPENLSLKKDDSRSPPIVATVTPPLDNLCKNIDLNNDSRYIDADWTYNFAAILRHAGNNFQGFMPYHQHAQQYNQLPAGGGGGGGTGHQVTQRSPVDVLLRVFPTRRRNEVEQLLQKYRGDVVQAMEAMLAGDEMMPPLGLQNSPQPFPVKSAFSPLVPPGAMGTRYPFMQQQHKRFLSAPYAGTGFLSTVIQDNDNHNESNRSNSASNSSANTIHNGSNNGNETRSIDSQE